MTHPTLFTTPTLALPNSVSWSSLRRHFFVGTLAVTFACFGLPQTARGQDGDYGRANTAEGGGALHTIITNATAVGSNNTAIGKNALFSDTSGASNMATGDAALESNTTGSGNTATGHFALSLNTTGRLNTASGSSALFSNTTGQNNTAIGASALLENVNGNDNTAAGFRALASLGFDGIDNTAIGSGALFSQTSGGFNTAIGFNALFNNTASNNTAVGDQALLNNTNGTGNMATGVAVLFKNTTGNNNTAEGSEALFSNTTGSNNTADGLLALENNTIGHDNSAEGFEALANNTTGSSNIALGSSAGINLTTGSNNIEIGAPGVAAEANTIRIGKSGTQKKAFVAGIRGVTVASGVGVIVGTTGQLGTVLSSARFKEEIKPMDKASEAILQLKPVTFYYKHELDPDAIPQFGLIAEQVEKVNPDLVVRDEDGKATTVRYEAVNAMLLNEFLKEHRKVAEQQAMIDQLKSTVAKQEAAIGQQGKAMELLAAHVKEQDSRTRVFQTQLSKARSQMVVNNRPAD
jgi:uncharacterized coiled-coil protein SlyX